MVALASIAVMQPALLLLDEPSRDFDAYWLGVLEDWLDECRQQGTAVLTISHDLDFVARLYEMSNRKEAVDHCLADLGLTSRADQLTGSLSGGWKQRLALACSLMHEPDILFLDEPTSGVDPLTRREFWLHINSMVEKGVTVMVTTHFMDEAEYCDRIGLVYRGKLIASGTPDDLKALAADDEQPDPTMEQAFITLIHDWDKENAHAQ